MLDDSANEFILTGPLRIGDASSGDDVVIDDGGLCVGIGGCVAPADGDLLVESDLVVGDTLLVDNINEDFRVYSNGDTVVGGRLYVDGASSYLNNNGPDGDSTMFFYDGSSPSGEYLRWDDTEDRFALSNGLYVSESASGKNAAYFFNDGGTNQYYGISIQSGTDIGGTGYLIDFKDGDGTLIGDVSFSATTVSYNPFTGSHTASIPEDHDEEGYPYGMVLCIRSAVTLPNSTTQPNYHVEPCRQSNEKAVFGVYGSKNARIANSHYVFAVGDGHILVTDFGGDVELGDYLASSNRTGYAMKQDDDLLHSYTVAKATEPVNWDEISVDPKLGFKWKLVSCTYHAA